MKSSRSFRSSLRIGSGQSSGTGGISGNRGSYAIKLCLPGRLVRFFGQGFSLLHFFEVVVEFLAAFEASHVSVSHPGGFTERGEGKSKPSVRASEQIVE